MDALIDFPPRKKKRYRWLIFGDGGGDGKFTALPGAARIVVGGGKSKTRIIGPVLLVSGALGTVTVGGYDPTVTVPP